MDSLALASSSALDVKTNRRQPRKRADQAGYVIPGIQTPRYVICDRYGPRLEPSLVPLARALFAFDLKLLRRVQAANQKNISSSDEARNAEAVQRTEEFLDVKQQWKEIDSGQCRFSKSYLETNQFIPFWVEGLQLVKDSLASNKISGNEIQKRLAFQRILTEYEHLAGKLRDQLIATSDQGLLEEAVLYSIQERWIRLDELLDWYYDLCYRHLENPNAMFRDTPKWHDVRSLVQVKNSGTRPDKNPAQARHAGRSVLANQSDTMPEIFGKNIDGAMILWSTLLGCTITSTALFALGYAHSPHLRGTTKDADFWFLIQSTIMQLLGLSVSAILEWKSGDPSKWRWAVPIALAGACSASAVPLYLIMPTEWSSFLSLVAGATQSFMVLQYLLF